VVNFPAVKYLPAHKLEGKVNKSASILLVEDVALIAASEAKTLRNEGYAVILVFSGEEAFEKVEAAPGAISLILMDIDLGPGKMDGIQTAERILKKYDIPIVFVSSHTESEIVEKTEQILSYGYVVKGSGSSVLAASVKMAFKLHAAHLALQQEVVERKRADESRKASEAIFRLIASRTPDHIVVQDRELRYLYVVNPQLGLTEQGMLGKTDRDILPGEDAEYLTRIKRQVLEIGQPIQLEVSLDSLTGKKEYFDGSFIPKFDSAGAADGLIGYFRNITERKQSEETLRKKDELMQMVLDNSRDGINLLDLKKGRYTLMSPGQVALTGFSAEEMNNFSDAEALERVHPDDREISAGQKKLIAEGEKQPWITEYRWRVKSGEYRWFSDSRKLVHDQLGQPIALVGVSRDITERKQAEETLRQALADKDKLMRELQHRVKNSLNMVASLLGLEESNLPDERTRLIFANIKNRIHTISSVYDQLYRTGGIDRINLGEYIQQLVNGLSQSYVAGSNTVSIQTQLEEIQIDVQQALSLGIIVNELVTNALKYAFPTSEKPGVICIGLERAENNASLTVVDNGVGISPEKLKAGGLGLVLVKMLTRQIGGEFEFDCQSGCAARVSFGLD